MSRRKSFKILTIGGWLVRILQIGNNLLLIPLYLKYIGVESYGYWLASGGVLAWVAAFDFGVVGIIKLRCAFYFGKNQPEKAAAYFQTGLIIYSLLLLLMLGIAYGLSFVLDPLLNFPAEDVDLYRHTFMLAALAVTFAILKNALGAYLHALQRPVADVFSSVLGQLINLIVVIYLLLWTSLGLWVIPIGMLSNHLLSTVCVLGYLFLRTNTLRRLLSFQRAIFFDYLTISPILFFSRLGSQLTAKIEPTLIVMYLTPELATMFTVAKRLIEVMMGFANTVRGGMMAGFSHYFGEKGAGATVDLLDRILQMTLGMSFAIALVYLASNRPFVGVWVGPELYIGTLICALIGLEALTRSVGDSMIQLVGALGEMRRSSVALLAESIVKVGLMFLFLPLLGIVGLPLAALLSGAAKAAYSIRRLKSNLAAVRVDIARPLLAAFLALGLLVGAALLGSYGAGQNHWLWLLLTLVLSGLCAAAYVIWAFPFVRCELSSGLMQVRARLPIFGPKIL
jgi:O-antigen/teichoic acid export membrane protein